MRGVESFAGYDVSDIENALYTVANSGIDSYTIVGPARASITGFGGGKNILASYNVKNVLIEKNQSSRIMNWLIQ